MAETNRYEPTWPVDIVVPTRNEAGNVAGLVERLPLVAGVIFVDDSDDDTVEAIEEAASKAPMPVTVIHRPPGGRGGGLSGAVEKGFANATSPWICVMDGDLQHPPEVVLDLALRAAEGDTDLVIASRRNWDAINEGLGPVRRVVSWSFGKLAFALFRSRLRAADPLSGFFMVRTESLHLDRLNATGFKILLEILVTHPELRVCEIGFNFQRRAAGESNGSLLEGARYLAHVSRLWRRSRQASRHVMTEPGKSSKRTHARAAGTQ